MKKLTSIFPLLVLFLIIGCSSDDNSSVEVDPTPVVQDWIPNKINLLSGGNSVYEIDYPHAEGCSLDYLSILDNKLSYYKYAEQTCELSITELDWNRSGNDVTFDLFGSSFSGKIILETESKMVVAGKAAQLVPIIIQLYPELSSMIPLLQGLDIDKK